MPGDCPDYNIILSYFLSRKKFFHFRNVSYLNFGPSVCASCVCSLRPPSPWSQTAAHCSQFVPIISIYSRHKQSCGKPQKLALLAQLTSTLLHLIPSYHIAHPSPCRYRYVEPLTRLQDASKTATLGMRNMKAFIRNEAEQSKKCYSQSTTKKMRRFIILCISVRRCTCFGRFFRPSSGAQNCTYSVRYL